MQLSTKSRYATRAMVELARYYGQGPVQLKEIASSQDISVKYLEQVLLPLRTSGYIYTVKGARGGYCLSENPEKITVYNIVECVEGSLAPVACVDKSDFCQRTESCVTREVWARLKTVIARELEGITLADLAKKAERLNRENKTSSIIYYI